MLYQKVRSLAVAAIVASGMGVQAAAGAEFELRAVTPWVEDDDLSKPFFMFKEKVQQRIGDRITINYLGGPEVMGPTEQFEGVRNRVVDIILGAAAYYRAEVPAASAVQFTRLLPSQLRQTGYFDLLKDLHEEQGNVILLANVSGGNTFRLYLTNEINEPNLDGLRIRVSPVYQPLVEALGGVPVSMAPGEVYTGLERGIVDGFGWTYTGIDLFSWHEVANYVVDHSFYSTDVFILFNEEAWAELPDDIRAELEAIAVEVELMAEDFFAARLAEEDEHLKGLGMEFIQFEQDAAASFIDTAYEAGWQDFVRRNETLFRDNPELESQLIELGQ